MEVYVELAIAENFCMDYTLLYCAKLASKNLAGFKRIAVGASLGAAFAVILPLFNIPLWASIILKIVSGVLLCLVSGKFKNFKGFLKFTLIFLGFTFLLGGALIGIFSLAGIKYQSGGGFILSSVPIGIPLFGALVLIIVARKIAKKLAKGARVNVGCKIFSGGESVEIAGFFDSGNRVYHLGCPVSVIPESAAKKIVDVERIKEGVKIHTVAGSKKIKVFTADKIEISKEGGLRVLKNVKIGISGAETSVAVLHSDLLEE